MGDEEKKKKKEKKLYLSVRVFSTVVLIVDTLNKQTNIKSNQKFVKNPN